MRLQGGRVTVVTVTVMVSLVCAARALGTTYCVKAPGCRGTQEAGVQAALDAAASHSGPDIIRVGPGTYHGPFTDASGNVVTLIGAGARTVFDDPSKSTTASPAFTVEVAESTSSFSAFAAVVPPGTLGTGVISLGRVDHVSVTDVASDAGDAGVSVVAGSLSHSQIVLAGTSGGGIPASGIVVRGGFIQDDLVHMRSPGARGIEASFLLGTMEARQLTLVGPGDNATGADDGASRGVNVQPTPVFANTSSTVVLDGVIISGFAHPLVAIGSVVPNTLCMVQPCTPPTFDGFAEIDVGYSDFNPANDIVGSVDSSIHRGTGNVNVDPGFKHPGAGDYALHRGSAVIDRGDPAVPRAAAAGHPADSTTDLAGNPRRSDGNGDGIARVDIGAFEYTNLVPVAAISAPAAGLVGRAVHFNGSASHDADGDPLTFSWSFGDGQHSTAARPAHTYRVAGRYTVRLVVTDALGARSAPRVVRIKVTEPRTARSLPRARPWL